MTTRQAIALTGTPPANAIDSGTTALGRTAWGTQPALAPDLISAHKYVAGSSPRQIENVDNTALGTVHGGGGTPGNATQRTLAQGTPCWQLSSNAFFLDYTMPSLAGGFTVAMVLNGAGVWSTNIGTGTSAAHVVGRSTANSGALRFRVGATTSSYGDYSGPALDTGTDRVIFLRYDPVTGTVESPTGTAALRVETGGAPYTQSITSAALSALTIHPGISFGRLNDPGGDGVTTVIGDIGMPMVWARPLADAEMTAIAAYFASLKA